MVRDDFHQPDAIGKATTAEVAAAMIEEAESPAAETDAALAAADAASGAREDAFLKEMGLA